MFLLLVIVSHYKNTDKNIYNYHATLHYLQLLAFTPSYSHLLPVSRLQLIMASQQIVSKCCVGCDHTNNRYYNDKRVSFGLCRCRCYDPTDAVNGRDRSLPHFKGCPFEKNGNPTTTEKVVVSPETVTFVLGKNRDSGKGSQMRQALETFYGVSLTLDMKPWTDEFNSQDSYGRYRDPAIVVTGLVATKNGNRLDSWCTVLDIIRRTDDSIRERRLRKEFGMKLEQHLFVGITLESYKTDPETMREFRENISCMFRCFPCVRIQWASHEPRDDKYPGRCNLIIEGMSWEKIEETVWMLKKTEAEQREVQKYRERKQTPPKCQLCEHTSKDCKKATEQYEWQQHHIRIGNETRHKAEWEKKIEDYYTNVSYHEEWMIAVDEKDHERELKEGYSKPEDWYYTKKYGWFRKCLIEDAKKIAEEGWNEW